MKLIIITFLVTLAIASAFDSGLWLRGSQKIAHPKFKINPAPSTLSDIAEVVKGNTDFAFDLFKTVDEGNVIFSPYSISVAMGMTFAGSKGVTKDQIKNTLHFENLNTHAVFRDLNSKLLQKSEGIEVNVANSLWSDNDYQFKPEYVDVVRYQYQGEVKSVNFKSESEVARKCINEWTANKTNNKIQNILAAKLNPNTKLVLVNAIYFNSAWKTQFNVIGKSKFTMLNGVTTEAEMMKVEQRLNYFKGSGFKSVSLSYKDEKSFLTVILPDEGKFSDVKKNLNTDMLSQIFTNDNIESVEVTMPKFKIETEIKLKENFKKLGMENPFTPSADFSGMDGTKNLYIDNVIHKAFIEVNENGTEAAAATAVVMVSRSIMMKPKIIVNRPFLYIIHDENNSVLFMGQVDQPSS